MSNATATTSGLAGVPAAHLDAVQAYVREQIEKSPSQNEAARLMGISPAHLINFREGRWELVSEKLFRQIAAKARLGAGWSVGLTTNLTIATNLLAEAKRYSRMFALVGYTGSGKTEALQLFCRKQPASYYVLCDSEMTKRLFLVAIIKACGLRLDNMGVTAGEMIAAIVSKLNTDSHPMLCLDDAGKLSDSVLRIIQIIYDRTERRCGIVLAGTEYLQESFERKARLNKPGFRELRRRVAFWEQMQPISNKDLAAICDANGVTDASAITYLHRNVADYGTLRNLVEIASQRAAEENTTVTRELLAELVGAREIYSR